MADALAISRKLTAAGVEQKPAEAMAEVVVEHYPEDVATKGDLARLEKKMDKRMDALEKKADANYAEMRVYFKVLTSLMVALVLLTLAPYFHS